MAAQADATIDRTGIWRDTRAMGWSTFPGLGSAKVKVLQQDEQGNAMAFLVWMPPGDLGVPLPHRHYHATVHEYAYTVSGDLPHWEYADPSQDVGDLVLFRECYYMDRRPGSIHGLEEGLASSAGSVILFWRDGVGNWLDEPEAATETIDVAYGQKPPPLTSAEKARKPAFGSGVVLERPDLSILDTREMTWEDHDGIAGTKIKVLSRHDDGEATVSLLLLPPGDLPRVDLPHRHFHRTVHECGYVLEGEVLIWEYADAEQQEGELVVARPGYFMNRPPGSLHGIEAGASSPTGAVILEWRSGPGTYVDEPGAADETITVPYAG